MDIETCTVAHTCVAIENIETNETSYVIVFGGVGFFFLGELGQITRTLPH